VHRSLGSAISKPRSLTLDRLDRHTLKLFEVIGNQSANEVLEEGLVDANRIDENVRKDVRESFIRRKYAQLEFVKITQVDMFAAIRDRNYRAVFRAICFRGAARTDQGYTPLHCAASVGDPVMTLLVAHNQRNPTQLDRGWSALSYAAYYGRHEAANVLVDAGYIAADEEQVHPYEIAMAKKNEEMALLFLPFWTKTAMTPKDVTPPEPLRT
jgi:hypothetical protein